METFNPKNVFEATNRQLSVDELKNKIALLKSKLDKLDQDVDIPDLMSDEKEFSDSLSSFDESAKLRVEISDLYEILAEKEGLKKAA